MTTVAPAPSPGELRVQLHEWLAAHREKFADAGRHAESPSLEEAIVPELALQRALWDEGFTRWGWPAE